MALYSLGDQTPANNASTSSSSVSVTGGITVGHQFKSFFDSYPDVKTIHWTQYAPYFNDGDECVFSVNEPHFTRTEPTEIEDREHAWGEGDDGIIETRVWDSKARRHLVNPDVDANLIRDMDTFTGILQSEANEAVMQAMFGNHVWVKAHRDGFEVDDYDHD